MGLNIFGGIDLSSSGLRGQRARMQVVSENIANSQVTRTEDGGPYRRKQVIMESADPGRQRIVRAPYEGTDFARMLRTHESHLGMPRRAIERALPQGADLTVREALDATPFQSVYDPTHPDADDQGYVLMPNVNVVTEMVDLVAANRAYEANVSAIEAAKDMFLKALEI